MNLIIAISGCSGGNAGPRNLYHSLENEYSESANTRFLPMDTIPDDLIENIRHVSDLAQTHMSGHKNIHLMGYSMGGGIAAIAADKLNRQNPQTIKGVILLNSQSEGVHALDQLSIPIVFIHGKSDSYFETVA